MSVIKNKKQVLDKQVWITSEAYEYCRKIAFKVRKPVGQVISAAILCNVLEGSK